jgi:hypothetical protein
MHRAAVHASVDERLARNRIIACYLEGWAEANPAKILAATDAGFSFHDPLVGFYSRRSLPEYFERLQARFAYAGKVSRQDLSFHLRGPMDRLSRDDELAFWREAPQIGLTGISLIKASPRGVLAESVTYDHNLASGVLSSPLL